jgi:hypothetical protein
MVRSLRAIGAFLGGLLGVFVLVIGGTSIVLGGILREPASTGEAVGAALFLPMLICGSLLGWWLAKRSLAETAAPAATTVSSGSVTAGTAGWYADQQGQLRWWDGGVWTQHVAGTNTAPQSVD